ncbi:MAG: peptidase C11 [Clostridia bacterium]|nr:peptidase C11 [Clostridia bacterium]
MNRKKNVTGTADDSAMQTHGPARTDGPVGDQNGYQDRKDQQAGAGNQRAAGQTNASNGPMARPKNVSGQAGGSMNTHSAPVGGGQPQQTRPSGAASNPFGAGRTQQNPFGQQTRPQQSARQQRPSSAQQSRPQQSSSRPASSQRPPVSGGGTPQNAQRASGTQSTQRAGGGRSPLLIIIAVVAVLLLGGGGGLSGLFGGGSSNTSNNTQSTSSLLSGLTGTQSSSDDTLSSLLGGLTGGQSSSGTMSSILSGLMGSSSTQTQTSSSSSDLLSSLLGGSWYSGQTGYGSTSSSGASTLNTALSTVVSGVLNRNVASGSRDKYTTIAGNGKDKVTIMVYMCGADLESRSGMGTKDLQEMLNATLGSKIKLIVFTGGSTNWRNDKVSSKVNQIWQIDNGKMTCLNDNAGTASMTTPSTLSSFIQYCAKNFKANRYALILWDHGSGSVSGYGYDEKNTRSGSMTLAGLNTAFENGGVKFDFIGFDACLMATVENALMCSKHADYLIASEETEPGIGWYYTDWLTAWGKNTSMDTLEIGQKICDDFVSKCASSCRGQQTTLSVVDLAELSHTVPDKLTAFSKSVSAMIANKEYQTVSAARNGCREFATSSRIDQVDLTDLCAHLNTTESQALAKVLKEAVKYNRIGNISNAHGLSIYFPYNKVSNVDKAVSTYAAIGMDDSYSQAIRDFAGVEASGQAVASGGSLMGSLFGSSYSSSPSSSSDDMISDLLSAFLGGGYNRVAGLSADNTGFLSGASLKGKDLTEYLTAHILDADQLVFAKNGENWALDLTPEQWALVTGVDQNVFYDNGAGYVDLGLDNLFFFDELGRLVADMDGTWLAINGQVVPYYHETSQYLDNGGWIITGRVPALVNGVRMDLLLVFDNEHEDGYVAGARAVYTDETETVAKALDELEQGAEIVFLADLYDYNQNYTASYAFGKSVTVDGELKVSNVYLPDKSKALVTYRITDIYQQAYWTPVIGK